MKLFKASYTKMINGVRVTKKTKSYYGRLREAGGKTIRVSLLNDRYSSERMLADLQKEQDQMLVLSSILNYTLNNVKVSIH